MSYLDICDVDQGRQRDGHRFGFCGIEDRGGYFFTHHETLRETLDSIEADKVNPPKNWPKKAIAEVRGFVRRCWSAGKIKSNVE